MKTLLTLLVAIALTGCYKPLAPDEYYVVVCEGSGYSEAHLFTDVGDNRDVIHMQNGVYVRYKHGKRVETYKPLAGEKCKKERMRVEEVS